MLKLFLACLKFIAFVKPKGWDKSTSKVVGLKALSLIRDVSGLLFEIFLPCEAEKSKDGRKSVF